MSSMSQIMQKLDENATAPAAGDAAPAAADLLFEPPVNEISSAGGTSDPVVEAVDAAARPSSFVSGAGGAVRPAPVRVTDWSAAASWDPRQVDPAIIAFHDRGSPVCEQFRAVRARLLTMNPGRAAQAIAITSSVAGEGKSVSTLNLALVMAEGGEQRVIAVDADLRNGTLARLLGRPATPGLAELLCGTATLAEVLQPTPLPNLKFIPAGQIRAAGGELLSRPGTGGVIDQLRATFHWVFLDTPPITTVSDVSLLAPRCDGALVVIAMRRTPELVVQQAVRTLQANRVPVLGCLLSRCTERNGIHERDYGPGPGR